MKNLICITFILFSVFAFAQNANDEKVVTPKIVSKLKMDTPYTIENIQVKLVEVVSDSRCPKGVSCVWAGEAVVLVDIFKDGEKLEQKKVTFKGDMKSIFSSEKLSITGYGIMPYPEVDVKINPNDYYLQLEVKNL